MNTTRRTLLATAAAGAGAAVAPGMARGSEAWPSRTVRVVVPYSPGGGADVVARLLSEGLRRVLGQNFVVENRPGANGVIGSQQVAASPGDGYTVALLTGTHVVNRYAMGSVPFDPIADFAPIALVCQYPNVLAASVTAPFRDVAELVAYARANPRRVAFGSSEAATSFAGNEFARLAGVEMEEVAYRGGAPLMNDVVAGNLPTGWTSTLSVGPFVGNDRIRILGVSSKTRNGMLPDVPAIAEAGVPGYEFAGWYGLFGPASLRSEIVARLHGAAAQAMSEPGPRERMAGMGADVRMLGPAEFAAFLRDDDERWARAAAAGRVARLQ